MLLKDLVNSVNSAFYSMSNNPQVEERRAGGRGQVPASDGRGRSGRRSAQRGSGARDDSAVGEGATAAPGAREQETEGGGHVAERRPTADYDRRPQGEGDTVAGKWENVYNFTISRYLY